MIKEAGRRDLETLIAQAAAELDGNEKQAAYAEQQGAQAFDELGGTTWFTVMRMKSFADLYLHLKKNIPVVVSVRGVLTGAPKEYENGHLMLVVGWDKEKRSVVCHDPAFPANDQVLIYYQLEDFCRAWGSSHCLSYLAERRAGFETKNQKC